MTPITVGLYSFPKSGNTWLRHIVARCFDQQGYEAINAAVPEVGVDPVGRVVLTHEDRNYIFYKSHAWHEVTMISGMPLFNDLILHIRRNPLDVFVSYMNYMSANVENTAPVKFDNVDSAASSGLLDHYFGTFLTMGHIDPNAITSHGGYFKHNLSWVSHAARDMSGHQRIFPVRYEDLLKDFTGTMTPFWDACRLSLETLGVIAEAHQRRHVPNGKFFWKMKRGTYLEYLDHNKVADFIKYHEASLAKLGYLDMLRSDIGL